MNQRVSPHQTGLIKVSLHTSPARAAEIRRRLMAGPPRAIALPAAPVEPLPVSFQQAKILQDAINMRDVVSYFEGVQVLAAETLFCKGVGEAMKGYKTRKLWPKIGKITAHVGAILKADCDWIIVDRRRVDFVRARQVVFYTAREFTPYSFPKIGAFFGARDHTTIMHGAGVCQRIMEQGGFVKPGHWRDAANLLMALPLDEWARLRRASLKARGGRP